MDSIMPTPAPNRSSFSKAFQKAFNPKTRSKNHGFRLPIPQEKLKCCESKQVEQESLEEAMEESKSRAAMEAFVAKLFATVSSLKAAYAELQMAQFPYNNEAIQSADQAIVDELKALSDLKRRFSKQQIDSSPPHVTLMLAEIQEQQSLMKTYEITMKKMQGEIQNRESKFTFLQEKLQELIQNNKSLEKKLNASGAFSVLDSVKFSDLSPKDFVLALNYSLRSVRNFVKCLIQQMQSSNWDIEAAATSIHSKIRFENRDHKAFAFESHVCRVIFSGFNYPAFSVQENDQLMLTDYNHRRNFFSEQFKKLKSVSVINFLKQNPNSLFGKFLKSKYLHFVHPKMEFSFFGNLNQRKMVNSGEYPESDFFKLFAEMGRRIWLLHCLAFSFDQEIGIFQVKENSRFSEVYMESVTEDVLAAEGGELRVAFTVVPGFKLSRTVVQSQVYLFPAKR